MVESYYLWYFTIAKVDSKLILGVIYFHKGLLSEKNYHQKTFVKEKEWNESNLHCRTF